jgi:hypothetical protein
VTTKYKELFQIQCRHGYFADHRCRALELSPTEQCGRLLDRYRCLFRATAGGGAVFYGEDDGQSLLRRFEEATPFTFFLTNPDRQLATITEIGTDQTGAPAESLYYFNNLRENAATVDGVQTLLLHPAGDAFAGGPLPIRPAQFVCPLARTVRAAKLELFDALQREIWNSQTPAGETASVSLNLSNVASGRHQLRVNGEDAYDFYLSDMAAAKHWGLIEIFAGGPAMAGIVPKRCQVLDENGGPQAPGPFTIALKPRESCWRYYIISQSTADRTYDGYQIVGGAPRAGKTNGSASIAFSPPTQQEVNGKDAWVFESINPIPLYEVPGDQHEFNLKSNGRADGGAGPAALPYGRADTTRLEHGPDGKPRMCSEIFVYL